MAIMILIQIIPLLFAFVEHLDTKPNIICCQRARSLIYSTYEKKKKISYKSLIFRILSLSHFSVLSFHSVTAPHIIHSRKPSERCEGERKRAKRSKCWINKKKKKGDIY